LIEKNFLETELDYQFYDYLKDRLKEIIEPIVFQNRVAVVTGKIFFLSIYLFLLHHQSQ